MKIVVLGAGLVGRHIAADLAKDRKYDVSIADINKASLSKIKKDYGNMIETIESDLITHENIKKVVKDAKIVVNAVPGSIGFAVLRSIIESGKDVVDIAFYGEDPMELDNLARSKDVTSLVDFGIAPGVSNLVVGDLDRLSDDIEDIKIYVGGLPKERKLPFEYKAVFSPSDVIEEYTRPARVVENGKVVVKSPLTEPEFLDFKKIGTLEAFNSDGLRTLIKTIKAENMMEKTLRYPGHREKMKFLFDAGLFGNEKIEIGNVKISPLEVTSNLLFDHWKFTNEDRDFTVMRIIVSGFMDSKRFKYTFDLYDEFDEKEGVHSMARTTGFTATMGVRLLAGEKFTKKGVYPPELVGMEPGTKQFVLEGLNRRNISFSEKFE